LVRGAGRYGGDRDKQNRRENSGYVRRRPFAPFLAIEFSSYYYHSFLSGVLIFDLPRYFRQSDLRRDRLR
jgi:hypothetical protein